MDNSKNVIGIIGAMDAEVRGIESVMNKMTRTNVGGSDVVVGTIHGRSVALMQSGIGKVNAAFAAQLLIREFNVSRLYMTGIAGGMGGRLHTLDLLIPDLFVQYDVIVPGEPDGYMDILDRVGVLPDEKISAELAAACGATRGTMATGERFVDSEEDKADILRRFPTVVAADMESGAVAQVCARLKVPMACVKVISDAGDVGEYYDFKMRAAEKAISAVLSVL